jgi:hypothetical protein
MAAPERVERPVRVGTAGPTMRTAVSIRTPANAATGMRATSDPAARTTPSRTSEWTMADNRVCSPDLALTAVRAMAPVDGMPPNTGEATDVRPCPTNSRLGSLGGPSVSASATLADRRLSMAARTARSIAAETSSGTQPSGGSEGMGSDDGRVPIRATFHPAAPATTVAATTPINDAGRARWRCGSPTMATATTVTRTSHSKPGMPTHRTRDRQATTAMPVPAGLGTPRAVGTCWRKMMTAIPTAHSSTTGQGT